MQEHLYQTEQEQRANAGPPTPPPYSTYAEVLAQPRRVRPRRPPPQPAQPTSDARDKVPLITVSAQTDPVPTHSEVSCQTANTPATMSISTQTDPPPATTIPANSTEPDPRDDASKTSDRTPVAAYHRVSADVSLQPDLGQSSDRYRYTRPTTRASTQQSERLGSRPFSRPSWNEWW